jgi:hypothetical protein
MYYGGRPEERVAVGKGAGLTYIVNPSLAGADEMVAIRAVGFPMEAVFEYESDLFGQLVAAFAEKAGDLSTLWEAAHPLGHDRLPEMDDLLS